MAHQMTIADMRSMQIEDLVKEANGLQAQLAKMRLGIDLKKEKDTAEYRRRKQTFARLMTVLGAKRKEGLPAAKTPRTVSAHRAAAGRPKNAKAAKGKTSSRRPAKRTARSA